jgi:hypothetical protein
MRVKLIAGIAVVVVLVVVAVLIFGGGDDNDTKSAGNGTTKSGDKATGKSGGSGGSSGEPALTTIKVGRDDGKTATANAGAIIRKPGQIWIRVSAAPKQPVRVTWSLACGGGKSSQDNYVITPPHLRELAVPKGAKTCVASVAGQLVNGTGRLKVAVLRGG